MNDLNRVNIIFKSHSNRLHLIWTESKELLNSYSNIILDESNDKVGFLENLSNFIDFDHWMYEFTVNLQEISDIKEVEFTKLIFKTLHTYCK